MRMSEFWVLGRTVSLQVLLEMRLIMQCIPLPLLNALPVDCLREFHEIGPPLHIAGVRFLIVWIGSVICICITEYSCMLSNVDYEWMECRSVGLWNGCVMLLYRNVGATLLFILAAFSHNTWSNIQQELVRWITRLVIQIYEKWQKKSGSDVFWISITNLAFTLNLQISAKVRLHT